MIKKEQREKGQVVVEFTLVALLFLMLTFAIIEFSHLFYTRLNLQHALREAGRYMITGQGLDPVNPNARLATMKNMFCNNLIGTGLSCADIDSRFVVNCPGGCSQPAGGPGQTVTVTVTYPKPWFTPMFNNIIGGPIALSATSTWKNEPYLPS